MPRPHYVRHPHATPWKQRLAVGACCASCAQGKPCASGAYTFAEASQDLDTKSLIIGGVLGWFISKVLF